MIILSCKFNYDFYYKFFWGKLNNYVDSMYNFLRKMINFVNSIPK